MDQPNYQLHVTNLDPTQKSINFQKGETIVGETSGAKYSLKSFSDEQTQQTFYRIMRIFQMRFMKI